MDLGAFIVVSPVVFMIIAVLYSSYWNFPVLKRIGNKRIKLGERVLSRGTKYIVVRSIYRYQARVLIFWFTIKTKDAN